MEYSYLDYLHIEFGLEKTDVKAVPMSGNAFNSCNRIAKKDYVIKQLEKFNDDELADAVKKLCDNPEITDRHIAIMYIVWISALDIQENW